MMIPFPSNWLKSQPWTRIRKAAWKPPLTRDERKQRDINREWGEVGNGTREG